MPADEATLPAHLNVACSSELTPSYPNPSPRPRQCAAHSMIPGAGCSTLFLCGQQSSLSGCLHATLNGKRALPSLPKPPETRPACREFLLVMFDEEANIPIDEQKSGASRMRPPCRVPRMQPPPCTPGTGYHPVGDWKQMLAYAVVPFLISGPFCDAEWGECS